MKVLGIIPSRYHSQRFPAKALVDIKGKSMVSRVYEQASKSQYLDQVVVATDHRDILDHLEALGMKACLTKEDHGSGTERCCEALQQQPEHYDFVVNIQGDEPFIQPQQIDALVQELKPDTQIFTLIKPITDQMELTNPNVVKAVISDSGQALYFSRSPLPYMRGKPIDQWLQHHTYYKHLGIYAYQSDILEKISQLPDSAIERAEALEQLRWLAHGFRIDTTVTHLESFGIDTPQDLEHALHQLSNLK